MILFFKVFFTEFIAEMGDKTQLMLIALTSKYKLRDIILGTGVAILILNGLAVLAGGLVSEFVPEWVIKMIAALAFLYFAASTIAGDDEEEEEEKDNEQETLSQREKEIITCVVKGMTNKAIADKLYLSIHTVITHRRNIARKLQIHSPAGLTIYAIVNKLVELSDIKDTL